VLVDGVPARSCVTRIDAIGDKAVTTIEAIGRTPIGNALRQAWLEFDVVQCGYCQSGQIISAAALLASTPKPSDADIDAGMAGNVCRCGTYQRIRAAIHRATV
jgi:isoquinoline 1-oxidoreductase alpha subunit